MRRWDENLYFTGEGGPGEGLAHSQDSHWVPAFVKCGAARCDGSMYCLLDFVLGGVVDIRCNIIYICIYTHIYVYI